MVRVRERPHGSHRNPNRSSYRRVVFRTFFWNATIGSLDDLLRPIGDLVRCFRLSVVPGYTNHFVDIRINSYDTRRVAPRSLSKEPAPPLPTDAEIAILAVLWRQGASTVREVHEALGKDSGYTTTLKLMQLMFEKGLVVRNERYRSHLYEARAPKEQTQRQLAGDLLERAFEGSAKSLVLGALAAQPASDKDLAEIRSLLGEFEKRRGKK